jgi:hypothetical protein
MQGGSSALKQWELPVELAGAQAGSHTFIRVMLLKAFHAVHQSLAVSRYRLLS